MATCFLASDTHLIVEHGETVKYLNIADLG